MVLESLDLHLVMQTELGTLHGRISFDTEVVTPEAVPELLADAARALFEGTVQTYNTQREGVTLQ